MTAITVVGSINLDFVATGPSLPDFLEQERQRSADYGGRSVFGWEGEPVADERGRATGGKAGRRGG